MKKINVYVDKEEILEIIRNQFIELINDNINVYEDVLLIIDDELQYTKLKDKEDGAIYISVKFNSTSINFGETTQDITMSIVAEKNKIDIAQLLLMEYATKYNLKLTNNGQLLQGYTTPAVTSNFNYVYDGFRTVLTMSGTFLISEHAMRFKVEYDYGEIDDKGNPVLEEIEAISDFVSLDNQLDPQAFYRTNNFTESRAKVATLAFSMTMFLVSNLHIVDDALKLMFQKVSNDFPFKIRVSIGQYDLTTYFRLANMRISQEPTSLSVVQLTFSN